MKFKVSCTTKLDRINLNFEIHFSGKKKKLGKWGNKITTTIKKQNKKQNPKNPKQKANMMSATRDLPLKVETGVSL